ncbi:MAG TPA: SRPBCC domain-containing protein [Kribbella sp.]
MSAKAQGAPAHPASAPGVPAQSETGPGASAPPETRAGASAQSETGPAISAQPQTQPAVPAQPQTKPGASARADTESAVPAQPQTKSGASARADTESAVPAQPQTKPGASAPADTESAAPAQSDTAPGVSARATTADREVVISRIIDAPPALVFEAFTDIRHLSQWWGPDGFTTTTRSFEFRVGGEWVFVLHGPDGTDYPEWISWTEIVPPERIALVHGEFRADPDAFESLITFEPDGTATRIEMRTVFPTKELRDEAVEKYHAIEGGQQTLGNLAAYITELILKGTQD